MIGAATYGIVGSRNSWPRWHIIRRSFQPSARPSSCWSWPSVSAARLKLGKEPSQRVSA